MNLANIWRILFLCGPLISSVSAGAVDLLGPDSEVPVQDLPPSGITTGQWYGLTRQGDRSDLIPVTMHLSAPTCPGRKDCAEIEKIVKVNWMPELSVLALVRGLVTPAGVIPTAAIDNSDDLSDPGKVKHLTLGRRVYELHMLGADSSSAAGKMSRQLVLQVGDRSQVLWDSSRDGDPSIAWDDPIFRVVWAGDLNGDGALDLLMVMTQKSTWQPMTLFLSGQGPNLVQPVARVVEAD